MEHQENGPRGENHLGLPIDPDVLFSNHKGVFKPKIEKRQTKLIEKVAFLEPFLWEDERILCVTTACSPMSLIEELLMGGLIIYIKRCLLVFTNMRVLHIPTKTNYSYRNSIAQIMHADCQLIAVKGRALVVRYGNGKKEKFHYVGSKERKKIKSLFEGVLFKGERRPTAPRTHLCPRCTDELVEEVYACRNCGLMFKSKVEARNISIIYPGGGYFYTRHPLLGLSDALVEVSLTAIILTSLVDMGRGVEGGGFETAVSFAIVLAIEKAVTVYDSNKFIREYIPIAKDIDSLE